MSDEVWAVVDDRPLAVFGIVTGRHGGVPWLLGTEDYGQNIDFILSFYQPFMDRWLRKHGYLYNFVLAENGRAVRWIRFLGFYIHEPEPFGFLGKPFHFFEIRGGENV